MDKLIEPDAVIGADRDAQELLDSLLDTFSSAGKYLDLKKIKGDSHELRFELAEPCKLTVSLTGKGYRTRAFIGGEELILEAFKLGKKDMLCVFSVAMTDDLADMDMDETTKVEMTELKARKLLPGFESIYRWAVNKEEENFIAASEAVRAEGERLEKERTKALKEKMDNWGSW